MLNYVHIPHSSSSALQSYPVTLFLSLYPRLPSLTLPPPIFICQGWLVSPALRPCWSARCTAGEDNEKGKDPLSLPLNFPVLAALVKPKQKVTKLWNELQTLTGGPETLTNQKQTFLACLKKSIETETFFSIYP